MTAAEEVEDVCGGIKGLAEVVVHLGVLMDCLSVLRSAKGYQMFPARANPAIMIDSRWVDLRLDCRTAGVR